jgi:cytochrome o ubiquinol oxidase subunit 2
MTIQVVSLDWKWLFIYPEQHVASVNFVQFPTDTPVNFAITSDSVMNSFWIPQLGGQMYSMPGMLTQLHLSADTAGDYTGASANISGEGFAGMKFTARASSQADFDKWIHEAKNSSNTLDKNTYDQLAKPSKNNPASYYAKVQEGLYDTIMMKYMTPNHAAHHETMDMPMPGMDMSQ